MTRPIEAYAPLCVVAAPRRSIVVVGDDPLMVRALDRLLRMAGYNVGIGEQSAEQPGARAMRSARSDIALTIVDIPDDWSRTHTFGPTSQDAREVASDKILWISAVPSAGKEPDRCLVKPFTSTQLLDKVRTLLSQQSPHA